MINLRNKKLSIEEWRVIYDLAEWAIGIYEDEPERAFVGVYGASICAVDNLTIFQAETIVQLHNREVAQLEERVRELEAEIAAKYKVQLDKALGGENDGQRT